MLHIVSFRVSQTREHLQRKRSRYDEVGRRELRVLREQRVRVERHVPQLDSADHVRPVLQS